MAINQKAMSENELKLRQFARNRARKLKARKLPIVDGYTASIRDENGAIVFSSVLDGWCFEYSIEAVKSLLANGQLKQSLNRKHDNVINERSQYT